jgi:hypothetical protein
MKELGVFQSFQPLSPTSNQPSSLRQNRLLLRVEYVLLTDPSKTSLLQPHLAIEYEWLQKITVTDEPVEYDIVSPPCFPDEKPRI